MLPRRVGGNPDGLWLREVPARFTVTWDPTVVSTSHKQPTPTESSFVSTAVSASETASLDQWRSSRGAPSSNGVWSIYGGLCSEHPPWKDTRRLCLIKQVAAVPRTWIVSMAMAMR